MILIQERGGPGPTLVANNSPPPDQPSSQQQPGARGLVVWAFGLLAEMPAGSWWLNFSLFHDN